MRDRARRARPWRGDAAALRHILDFLRLEGAIAAEKIPTRRHTPAERCADAYALYLRDARALTRATIVNYVPFVRGFLADRFGAGPVGLTQLKAHDVVRYVQQQARRLHLKRAKLLTSALRSFLRYARYRGEVRKSMLCSPRPINELGPAGVITRFFSWPSRPVCVYPR